VHPDAIQEILLAENTPLETICQRLVDAANEAGSPDNVTVVLIRVADHQNS
jgi:serine/threonine protein phosphatase PrpC